MEKEKDPTVSSHSDSFSPSSGGSSTSADSDDSETFKDMEAALVQHLRELYEKEHGKFAENDEEEDEEKEEKEKEGDNEGDSNEESSASDSSSGSSNTKSSRSSKKGKLLPGGSKGGQFHAAENTSSGTTIYIGEGSVFWRYKGILTIRFESPQTILLIDVTKCYISEINDKSVPNFKSPELVTNINFDGTIYQENFDSFVGALVNLKYLGIHLSSLGTLDFNRKGSQNFPNLENLNISGIGFTEEHARVVDMNLVVDNCIALLRFNFLKIIYLSISCPMVMCREEELTEAIFNFLARHKSSIKFLNLESLFKMGAAFYYDTDECPEDEDDPSFPPVEYDLSKIKGVDLVSFHLFFVKNTGSTELWRNFLLTQKHLEYCQFWCEAKQFPFYPLSASIVSNNIGTLHTFAFYLQQLEGKPIDCSIFKEAANLSTLLLKGSCINGADKTSVGITNFNSMPRSLCFIKILQLRMSKTDLNFIATKLPKLSRLYLEDVGEHGDFGLSLQDLCSLLQRKTTRELKSIHLVRSLNRDSFEESSGDSNNNDGYRIMAKILFKSQKYAGFQAELNEEEEFDIVQCEEEEDHLIHEGEFEECWDVLYEHESDHGKISCESFCDSGGGPTNDQCIQSEGVDFVEEGFQAGPGDIYPPTVDEYVQCSDVSLEDVGDYGFRPRRKFIPRGKPHNNYSFCRNIAPPMPPNYLVQVQKRPPLVPNSAPAKIRKDRLSVEQDYNVYHVEAYERYNSAPVYYQNNLRSLTPRNRYSNSRLSRNRNKIKIPETIQEHISEEYSDYDYDPLLPGTPCLECGDKNTRDRENGNTIL